jgi:hypothetical protein
MSRRDEVPFEPKCNGCYQSFSGPWCDNCDTWPCECADEAGDV